MLYLSHGFHTDFIEDSMKILYLTPANDVQKEINSLTEPAVIHLADGVYEQKIEIC